MTAALARETALPGPGLPAPFLHPWFELAKVGALAVASAAERLVTGGTIMRIPS